jgi:lysyl-tRNA synthetase class 2
MLEALRPVQLGPVNDDAPPATSRSWSFHWAREIVRRHGGGTLDYFALRDDKEHFFFGESLVAYGLFGKVCLVSPDPIGPEAEREATWTAFRRFIDALGYSVVVLGASAQALRLYAGFGMRGLYIGDEAVVAADEFHLAGGKRKGLRQAFNRIQRNGYTASFHDPRKVSGALADSILGVMASGRIGDEERGFSMTLGRIFDPSDDGLLLAVATDKDGDAVAFCQFVPAPAINGYSLDLMRWDHGEHANGLIDFLIVSTLEELRDQGMRGLGLNFAAMRAVVMGDTGTSPLQRLARFGIHELSSSVQIESLCRFDAKYGPEWQARYVAYDAKHRLPTALLAIARAESLFEMPLIGRFIRRSATRS